MIYYIVRAKIKNSYGFLIKNSQGVPAYLSMFAGFGGLANATLFVQKKFAEEAIDELRHAEGKYCNIISINVPEDEASL